MSNIEVKGKYDTSVVTISKKDDDLPTATVLTIKIKTDNPIPRTIHKFENGHVSSSLVLSYHNAILLASLLVDFIEKNCEADIFNNTLKTIKEENKPF